MTRPDVTMSSARASLALVQVRGRLSPCLERWPRETRAGVGDYVWNEPIAVVGTTPELDAIIAEHGIPPDTSGKVSHRKETKK